MNKLLELAKIFDDAHEKEVTIKKLDVFGYQYNYRVDFIKSVSKFWFETHTIEEHMAPLNSESNNDNRPGTIKESTEYIVVHDTASAAPTANEFAHAKYVQNGGGGTSWHYSVGDVASCHQIPDNEVAYHAGDQLKVKFEMFNTNVKGINPNPKVEIIDNYYVIDSKRTDIHAPIVSIIKDNENLYYASDNIVAAKKAPLDAKIGELDLKFTNDDINDYGVRVDLIDGIYYMGPTYYNPTYKKIANRGGNLNSIGIETMVNQTSNLIKTWHRCAKLVAHLLMDNNLDLSRVKAHHFFSGKDCPMTLRRNNLWEYFLEMVKIEYLILKDYDDVKITLISDNDMLEKDGLIRIDKMNNIENKIINYQIKLERNNEELTLNYQTIIK